MKFTLVQTGHFKSNGTRQLIHTYANHHHMFNGPSNYAKLQQWLNQRRCPDWNAFSCFFLFDMLSLQSLFSINRWSLLNSILYRLKSPLLIFGLNSLITLILIIFLCFNLVVFQQATIVLLPRKCIVLHLCLKCNIGSMIDWTHTMTCLWEFVTFEEMVFFMLTIDCKMVLNSVHDCKLLIKTTSY